MTKRMALPRIDVSRRVEALSKRLRSDRLSALIVTKLENVRYLTGFSGSAGIAVVKSSGSVLFTTDGRYDIQSRRELEDAGSKAEIVVGSPPKQLEAIKKFLSRAEKIGIEADHVRLSEKDAFSRLLGASRLKPVKGLVEGLRRVKDEAEIARIKAAAACADKALGQALSHLKEGTTEADLAAELDHQMRIFGAAKPSFDTIVASGPNSALPHAKPSSRKIREGDLVVIDFGAVVDGYASDMTRTILVGEPKKKVLKQIFDVVLTSQSEGVRAAREGMLCSELDQICREIIEKEGYGELFVHSTGHGVGLEIHELPWVAPRFEEPLKRGEVVTVEPGIYIEGVGGVRIEDTIVVRNGVAQVLTRSPKELKL